VKVILLGDSIRMGYQPMVAQKLGDSAQVWGPEENGSDSRTELKHLQEWALGRDADVIHFNCGLHDLRFEPGPPAQGGPVPVKGQEDVYQVPIDEYARNVETLIQRLKEGTKARLIWATTTPIDDELHAKRGMSFFRRVSDVVAYNRAALAVVQKAGLEVNDLYEVIMQGGVSACLSSDGIHMNPRGYDLLAEAVVRAIGG